MSFAGRSTIAVCLFLGGCAGGRYTVSAPKVVEPVSATSYVYGHDGEVIGWPEELEVVKHFSHDISHWSILWTLVNLSNENHDISHALTDMIRSHDGDAIIHLEVRTTNLAGLNLLGVLPLVPTVARSHIEGDVVRVKDR